MPRKPCDSHQEFRITLGDFERKKLNEILALKQQNDIIDGVTATTQAVATAVGGLGVAGLAWAALIWVGLSFDEIVDKISGGLVGFLESSGRVNYTADDYGRELTQVEAELQALFIENQELEESKGALFHPRDIIAANNKQKSNTERARKLILKQNALRGLIAAIAEGEVSGYSVSPATGPYGHMDYINEEYRAWYYATYGENPPEGFGLNPDNWDFAQDLP